MSSRWDGLKRVFRLPLGRRAVDSDVAEELGFHLEERVEELMATGLTRAEAEREARKRFGDVRSIDAAVKAIDHRMVRRRTFADSLDALGRDVRFGLRALTRSRGFTLVAVLTLGLGIGANTAIFSAVNRVLLHPLNVVDQDRLYVVRQEMPGLKLTGGQLTPGQAELIGKRNELFELFAGVSGSSFNLTGSGEPQRISAARTMGNFFELFRAVPAAGRFYRPEDGQNGNTKIAVLSYGFWRSWAGGDPAAIGRAIELNGAAYQVIGVLPASFGYRRSTQVFLPMEITDRMRQQSSWSVTAIGRLPSGVTPEQLQSRLDGLVAEWQAVGGAPPPERHFGLSSISLVNLQAGELRSLLVLLMVAVSLVLLIACANVANLQLVRGSGRSRELAVRASLGAGRWPILRQLSVENGLLALGGGGLGLGLGFLAIRGLRSVNAVEFPALRELALDPPVLLFTAWVTMLAVLVFGVAPTLRAARPDLHSVLRDAGRGSSAGPGRSRLLGASAAAQVALSLMLLLGAGLLIKSLSRLMATDPGFAPEHVLTFRVSLPAATFQGEDAKAAFFDQLGARLAALPGIDAGGAISDLPFGEGRNSSPFRIIGVPESAGDPARHADMRFVHGDYFQAMGIPLKQGRAFAPDDRRGKPAVAIIDESLAKTYFKGESPIGRTINQGPDAVIVGVVGAIKHGDLTEADKPTIYYAYDQMPWYSGLYVTLRTRQEPAAVIALARARVAELDRNLPVYDVEPMQLRLDQSVGSRRLAMTVLTGFAVLALLLALLGVYGVLSYRTSRRVHELGIRMALGALPGDLVRMVLWSGLGLTLAGLALGLTGFLLLARLLSSLLYGVTPRDPVTIAVGLGVLAVGAVVASFLPARRAARVDPVEALREE